MAPILGIYASQISGHLFAPSGAWDSIATTTVGAGGAANITFSSIPSTYTHLQIRGIARSTTSGAGGDWVYCQFNTDTGSNYAHHRVFGNGTSASAGGAASQTEIRVGIAARNGNTAGVYGASVADILDYTNTSKNTTARSLIGQDENGGGEIMLYSGLWTNTAAITSIKVYPEINNFVQYTQFALYGIKGN
jgi:hypothetical protein